MFAKTTNSEYTLQNYGAIDIAKVFFTFCILALHSEAFPKWIYPVFRMAVPFFFITSGFFLFSKIKHSPTERQKLVSSYIWRNTKLYCVWFILLLPVTVIIRNWFDDSILLGILGFLRSLLFSSTFRVSWYISATIWGTLFICFLSKYMSTKYCILLSLPFYAMCCLFSNYGNLLYSNTFLQSFGDMYSTLFTQPYNSIPVSLLWISIGKYFAEQPRDKLIFSRIPLIGFFCSMALYALEVILIDYSDLSKADDCYFMLVPVSYFLFLLLLRTDVNIPNGKVLRKICTMTFVTHASVQTCLSYVLQMLIQSRQIVSVIVFTVSLLLCLLFSFSVIKLEKHPRMLWLKHLY